MGRLPDLVQDSQLPVEFRDGCTIHRYQESNLESRQRAVQREEAWKQERQIGGGAFGSVWLETCTRGKQKDAVRAVKKIVVRHNNVRDVAYVRELEAIAKFSHARYEHCFVRSLGWYEGPGNLCIAMEYCELGDLQSYLSSVPPLPETQAQEIAFQALEGVRYMHDNEFAHRDLKPANLLIKSQPPEPWWIKIADFGISKRIEESLGTPSTVKGTLQFMAPELLGLAAAHSTNHGSGPANFYAADMWSLGEIVFQMLTKQPVFPQLPQLILYVQALQPFPNVLLAQHNVSNRGQHFVSSTMLPSPDSRLNAVQALNHEWMKKCKSPNLNLATSVRREDEPSQVSAVDSLTERFATWSSESEHVPKTQASISPFTVDCKSQAHYLFSSQFSSGSKSKSDVAQTAYSNLPQPNNSILSQLPEQHMTDSQEAKPNAIDKKGERNTPEECCLPRTQRGHKVNIDDVGLSPYSILPAPSLNNNTARLWNAGLGALLHTLEGHTNWISAVAFSPDGELLTSASIDGTIRLWRTGSGALLHILEDHSGCVNAVAFSPDGKLLASASDDTTVGLWDPGSGVQLYKFKGHRLGATCVSFSPDGKLLASGSCDATVRLLDAGSGVQLYKFGGPEFGVTILAFSPNGKLLASAWSNRTVSIWDPGSGMQLHTLEGHTNGVTSIAFSPDGKLASASADGTAKIWDARSGALLHTLGSRQFVETVTFSSDGKLLASTSFATAKLWDAGSGALLHTLRGHQQYINALAFSPDGKLLASTSNDKTIGLWDAGSGALLHMLKGHTGWVGAIAFSPDGKLLASASSDTTVRLWAAARYARA